MSIGAIIGFILMGMIVTIALLMIGDWIFKWEWTCRTFGWHDGNGLANRTFDGCSMHSTCSKCDKEVMQDSQGNWF